MSGSNGRLVARTQNPESGTQFPFFLSIFLLTIYTCPGSLPEILTLPIIMPSFQSFFKSRTLIHVAGWLTFFLVPLLLSPPNEMAAGLTDRFNLESMIFRNLLLMALFYLNLIYFTPVILKKNGVGTFLLLVVPIVLLISFANWQIHHFLAEPGPPPGPPPDFDPPHHDGFGPGGPRRPMMMVSSLFASLLVTVIVTSLSTSIVLWNDWVKARQEEQERAFQKVASELAVLKLQISPHFLFNTLNNIRWLVRSKSEQAEEAVMKLSQLLRYILYQTNQDKIALDKELDNLQDYITLQQMRLTGHQNLQYTVEGSAAGKTIVPLLFIPLVENVFKYGDFSGPFQNRIAVKIGRDQVNIVTENQVLNSATEKKTEESGIGLSNIRKRLTLHYPDTHILQYSEQSGIFKLELELII